MMGEVAFTPTMINFDELLFSSGSNYLANYANSLFVATATTVIVLTVSTMAAYSLARLKWPRWMVHLILLWAIVFHMIPPITLVGAWFVMLRVVGLDFKLHRPHLGPRHAEYSDGAVDDDDLRPRRAARTRGSGPHGWGDHSGRFCGR